MSNYRVQNRIDKLGPRMKDINRDPLGKVTITRPSIGAALIDACIGETEADEEFPGVALTRVQYFDFIIDSADYDFGTGLKVPELGDTITRQDGVVYQVCSMGNDTPPYEYITSTNKRMRIHTRRV